MRVLSELFGSSPFGPLQRHMKQVYTCVEQVPALFRALEEEDQEGVEEAVRRIYREESAADEIKNDIRDHLPKSIFLPVARRDLLEMLDMQDSVADSAQDVADLVQLRPLRLKEPLKSAARRLVDDAVETCRLATLIADQFDELLEASFGGPESEKVLEMIAAVGEREEQADRAAFKLMSVVLEHEDDVGAVDVIFWLRVVEKLDQMSGFAEKMANRLRLLIAQ